MPVRFHICDHSNAPYLDHLPKERTAITCHDVLAIRGALGYEDAHCEPSATGVILQKWILSKLVKSKITACVSYQTLHHLMALEQKHQSEQKKRLVIYNAFNANFYPIPRMRQKIDY